MYACRLGLVLYFFQQFPIYLIIGRLLEYSQVLERGHVERSKRPNYRAVLEYDGILQHRADNQVKTCTFRKELFENTDTTPTFCSVLLRFTNLLGVLMKISWKLCLYIKFMSDHADAVEELDFSEP
jgi:hypothetical protein